MKTFDRLWLTALAAIALGACSVDRAAPGRELFDEQTGNTLTVVSKPLVFARERNDVAAYARDYVTLVAVEIDHSGSFQDYLLLYRWSTVDKRMLPQTDTGAGTLRLMGEGRILNLQPLDSVPVGASSIHNLHMPPHAPALTLAYAVDSDTLRFITVGDALMLQMPQEGFDAPFHLWEDGRRALDRFIRQTSSP